MKAAGLPWATRTKGLVGSVIDSSTSLLQRQTHDIVSFAMGSPAAEAVPSEAFSEIYSSVLASNGAGVFAYGATEGETALRDELLAIDDDGLIVEALPELVQKAGRLPKAIYVIPNFQNPTGTAMSLDRRLLLLTLAREWRSIIIDDDPYGMLRFDGGHIPGFRELGGGDPLVFSVRTFSKILAPGLRVGWVDADPTIVAKLIDAKQTMDTCTNVPSQRLSAECLRRGNLEPHLDRLRSEYHTRMRAMQTSLENHFSGLANGRIPRADSSCGSPSVTMSTLRNSLTRLSGTVWRLSRVARFR